MPDEDYEWFRARARLALSELAVSSALDAGAVGTATLSLLLLDAAGLLRTRRRRRPPALPAVLCCPSGSSRSGARTSCAAHPSSRWRRTSLEGRSSSLKPSRARILTQVLLVLLGLRRFVDFLRVGFMPLLVRPLPAWSFEFRTSSTTLAPPVAGSLGRPLRLPLRLRLRRSRSRLSKRLPIQALPVQASLVQASPVPVRLGLAEVDRTWGRCPFGAARLHGARAAAELRGPIAAC
ncbi:hypothetical protein EDB85DRAFT_2155092 [Lactarius pseudohatsudake]|nr:hypothetical protein EDB85DRAFT_2155092 [Lactarius pseudohatsudake]